MTSILRSQSQNKKTSPHPAGPGSTQAKPLSEGLWNKPGARPFSKPQGASKNFPKVRSVRRVVIPPDHPPNPGKSAPQRCNNNKKLDSRIHKSTSHLHVISRQLGLPHVFPVVVGISKPPAWILKQTNTQASKQASKQANKQTNKQTNKPRAGS